MTLEQAMVKNMTDRIMTPSQAAAVMELARKAKMLEAVSAKWDDTSDAYPPQFMDILWYSVRELALAYIDANCPKAFYRPLFVA